MVEWLLAKCSKSTWLGSIPVHDMNHFGPDQGSELIIDLRERISYDRKVTVLTSRPCGRVVIGKVLHVHMSRINPHP